MLLSWVHSSNLIFYRIFLFEAVSIYPLYGEVLVRTSLVRGSPCTGQSLYGVIRCTDQSLYGVVLYGDVWSPLSHLSLFSHQDEESLFCFVKAFLRKNPIYGLGNVKTLRQCLPDQREEDKKVAWRHQIGISSKKMASAARIIFKELLCRNFQCSLLSLVDI